MGFHQIQRCLVDPITLCCSASNLSQLLALSARNVLKPTTRCLAEFHRDSSSVETIASRRPLTLYNLSFGSMLDQISSLGGSRVLTGQAPVQKDLTKWACTTWQTFLLAKAITKVRVLVARRRKKTKCRETWFKSPSAEFLLVVTACVFSFQCSPIVWILGDLWYTCWFYTEYSNCNSPTSSTVMSSCLF